MKRPPDSHLVYLLVALSLLLTPGAWAAVPSRAFDSPLPGPTPLRHLVSLR
jgi:hypothetical protein